MPWNDLARRRGLFGLRKPAHSLLTGIIAFWKLEEFAGPRQSCVSRLNLSAVGTPTNTTGIVGNGVNLVRSSNQNLEVADTSTLEPTGDFTISFWFKRGNVNNVTNGLVAKGNPITWGTTSQYGIWFTGGNALTFTVSMGVSLKTVTGATITDSNWHHVVATFAYGASTSTMTLYLDGAQTGTPNTAGSGTFINTSGKFCIGAHDAGNGNATNRFDGVMDAVGIWSRVLTSDERAYLYNSGAGRQHPFER